MTIEKQQSTECVEPYGWKVYGVNSLFMGEFAEADAKAEAKRIGGTCITFPLYTSPPNVPPARASKPWVGLTDEERNAIGRHHAYVDNIIRATEAKLKEKNDF